MLIFWQVQKGVHIEDGDGRGTGAPHKICIPFQIANLQRRQAALRCAEEITWAPQFPIRFGNFKPVTGPFQNSEFCRCLIRLA
jgi:hypothetical protein